MKTRFQFKTAARQRGIAAIEFAIILPYMVFLLAFLLLFGRAFFHYGAAQQAARDAARYLSSVPPIALSTSARAGNELAFAKAIANMELAELTPGPNPPFVQILCIGGGICSGFGATPTSINVQIVINLVDDIFPLYTLPVAGLNGLTLAVNVTMRYVGI